MLKGCDSTSANQVVYLDLKGFGIGRTSNLFSAVNVSAVPLVFNGSLFKLASILALQSLK